MPQWLDAALAARGRAGGTGWEAEHKPRGCDGKGRSALGWDAAFLTQIGPRQGGKRRLLQPVSRFQDA